MSGPGRTSTCEGFWMRTGFPRKALETKQAWLMQQQGKKKAPILVCDSVCCMWVGCRMTKADDITAVMSGLYCQLWRGLGSGATKNSMSWRIIPCVCRHMLQKFHSENQIHWLPPILRSLALVKWITGSHAHKKHISSHRAPHTHLVSLWCEMPSDVTESLFLLRGRDKTKSQLVPACQVPVSPPLPVLLFSGAVWCDGTFLHFRLSWMRTLMSQNSAVPQSGFLMAAQRYIWE